jgi:hypothetical protein
MVKWSHLFTARQSVALASLVKFSQSCSDDEVRELLALTISKWAERNNSICDWMVDVECPGHLFTQQVLPPAWDFAEAVPLCESSGSYTLALKNTAENAASAFADAAAGEIHVLDACELTLPDESASVFFTDPPYYDAVPYSDLSDFFFVWLKRLLPKHPLLHDPYEPNNPLTPKDREAVQDPTRLVDGKPKDADFFQGRIAGATSEGHRILKPDGIGCVVFAHKTTEGWEALLSGMMSAGWTITASWPITTERSARSRARNSAALEASVHLVCRPRNQDAPIGDWADVLRELPGRVDEWMGRLQSEGVRGSDLVFACIGPALEIFSRYERVETADGHDVPLPQYLEKVWEVVGRTALRQILGREDGAGALEEDARLVALFLWTLQSTASTNGAGETADEDEEPEEAVDDEDEDEGGSSARKAKGYTLVYDVVRRFAQPLGIHLEDWEHRIIETKKGSVRLLPVSERARQLFGEDGAHAAADQLERPAASPQLSLFPEVQAEMKPRRGRKKVVVTASDDAIAERRSATTLDRVHAAMLLQSSGRANALRALLAAEVERGPEFLRLANALSALYPRESEEKRLLDAMLLAVPR